MSYHFELYPGRPILENQVSVRFTADDIQRMAGEAREQLDGLEERVYYIINLGELQLNLGELMLAARYAAQGSSPPLHHPNIIENIVITTDPMIVMAARSVNSVVFGNLHLTVFGTLAEALDYIEAKLSA